MAEPKKFDLASAEAEELKKLEALTANLPEVYRSIISPTLDNFAWLKAKLDETRALLENSYVLTKGPEGLKKHPGFEAYSQLFDRYLKALKTLLDILKSIEQKPDRKGTPLDEIRKSREKKGRLTKTNPKRRS